MENDKFIVNGFIFKTSDEANCARKELRGIQFLEENNNMDNVDVMIQVYHKLLQQQLFQTAVGRHYLKQIQERILEKRPNTILEPIELDRKEDNSETAPSGLRRAVRMTDFVDVGLNYRKKLKLSIIVNVILLLGMAAMFIIASTASNPNILNYETKLQDRYAQWEKELEEREQEIERQTKNNASMSTSTP